jgi:hypothetical protein
LVSAASAALAGRAGATSRDFIDETLVSQPFKARELGIEFGAETRLDSDYRLQGWYRWELESAPLSRWFLEAKLETTSRGAGLEWGGWSFGTRFRFLDAPRWPVDVSGAVEYEVETSAGKHPNYERELVPRLVVSRTFFGGLLATVDLGAASRLTPNPVTRFASGGGGALSGNRAARRWDRSPVRAAREGDAHHATAVDGLAARDAAAHGWHLRHRAAPVSFHRAPDLGDRILNERPNSE